jgi:peptide/nickel transport system substrate-binding protein
MFTISNIKHVLTTLSRREWVFVAGLTTLLALITLCMLLKLNSLFLVTVPAHGGTWKEGVVGTPRFINPVLALSERDRDFTELVYSGLMKKDSAGTIVPDLAQSIELSENNLTYTVTLKDDLLFQDNTPLTAYDVEFTVQKIQEPTIASPKRLAWEGVTVTAPDEKTVIFTLKQPYVPFIESLTVGILPSHIWESIASNEFALSDYNLSPIGAGPYRIDKITRSGGIPSVFTLKAWKHHHTGKPYINELVIKSYENEKDLIRALELRSINAVHGISAENAQKLKQSGFTVEHQVLPRIFALFFNASHNQIFTDRAVLRAIDLAIDKESIVENVLHGYGNVIKSPLPLGRFTIADEEAPTTYEEKITTAIALLEDAGWKLDATGVRTKTDAKAGTKRLEFSISTGTIPELEGVVEEIKNNLSALGISVTTKVYDLGTLNKDVIGPRDYDTLFFGQVLSTDADLYAFWHSRERIDPGLNIALYANPKVDSYLTDALSTFDPAQAHALYEKAGAQIVDDLGALFIYSPEFMYVHDGTITNLTLPKIVEARDRYLDITNWFIHTDRVWTIFAK